MVLTRRQLGAGLGSTAWLALGLAAVVSACGGGGPPSQGGPGTGGHGRGDDAGAGAPPSGQPLVCSVSNDVALGGGETTSPGIAFAGGRFAAAWTEKDASLHVAVFDGSGNQAGTHAVPTGPRASEPAVSALPGGGFLLVWQEPGAVRGMRIGADASPMGSAFAIAQTANGDTRPSAAANASGTLVAWTDTAGAFVGEVNGDSLRGKVALPGAAEPSLAASADAFGVVFDAGNKVGFARPSLPLGSLDAVTFRDAPGKANLPRTSPAGNGGLYVVWEDSRRGDGNETVYMTLVGADGKPGEEVLVTGEPGSANYPDVTTAFGRAAVVYYQFRDGPPAIYLSLRGADLRSAGDDLRIATHARFPRIASGDGTLGVVYAPRNGAARLALVTCH